ncbi:hypothetical protein [Bacillus subtilis]|uniref:hypothetical protein n=1 Tax=Bacillus subtilis TaxID=1423 RepID=UPI000D77709A|nr:hypothetical protein [Bacillus subtilis]AWM22990.1 hypothetical protein DJ572_20525 [Bacillus subtilis]QAW14523.1 hypothetical protein ETA10_21540 [Bacillus subtilis]WBU34473.1 hypothetical protein OSK17_22145 [Bacillus subtilis]
MNWSFIESFINFILDAGIVSVLGALILWGLKVYVNKLTDNHFNKNIANHQQELTKALKIVEFNYQRKMEDFTLYTNKRHQIYSELYKWICKAITEVKSATSPLRHRIDESLNLDSDGLKEIIEYEGFNKKEIERVIQKWNVNSKDGIAEANRIMDLHKLGKADEIRAQANNLFFESGLYLSDKLTEALEEIFDILHSMRVDEYMYLMYPDSNYSTEVRKKHIENRKKIENAIKIVRKIMKDELAVGDYNSPSELEHSRIE